MELKIIDHDLQTENNKDVILTSPLSLEGISLDIDYKASNILQLIFSLFKNIRPGADLTHFNLPPLFNFPKSQLQCYGELVYCVNMDMLRKCATGDNAVDRMISVVAWNLSALRRPVFGVAPFNPILGETHHASRGTLNVLVEQVSHHPPVTALHGTDEANNIELIWCQHNVPKFYGTVIDVVTQGKRRLNLLDKGESYVMNSPTLQFRLLPKPGASWGVWQSESTTVWAEVSKAILSKEWDKAREAKRTVEEKERELMKQRKSRGEDWIPKHFDLSYTPDFGWDCSPKQKIVSPAPIIFPI
ncbi:oxysterol-binding protein-related protein 4B-like [Chenopodium quinoa]|uniref:oxysterol-binding protein-related protein 4B-like n=1 Tax=Chenopodium quinoa TaxID=63459 RepID=UPI000B7820E4|nr:oxysterol-binding protein-related protein 4B-like [Chenopodium quinoa]